MSVRFGGVKMYLRKERRNQTNKTKEERKKNCWMDVNCTPNKWHCDISLADFHDFIWMERAHR